MWVNGTPTTATAANAKQTGARTAVPTGVDWSSLPTPKKRKHGTSRRRRPAWLAGVRLLRGAVAIRRQIQTRQQRHKRETAPGLADRCGGRAMRMRMRGSNGTSVRRRPVWLTGAAAELCGCKYKRSPRSMATAQKGKRTRGLAGRACERQNAAAAMRAEQTRSNANKPGTRPRRRLERASSVGAVGGVRRSAGGAECGRVAHGPRTDGPWPVVPLVVWPSARQNKTRAEMRATLEDRRGNPRR